MKRPLPMYNEAKATQVELLYVVREWREYASYLEGRLDILEAKPAPRARPEPKSPDVEAAKNDVEAAMKEVFTRLLGNPFLGTANHKEGKERPMSK